jgi:hypothetical protein
MEFLDRVEAIEDALEKHFLVVIDDWWKSPTQNIVTFSCLLDEDVWLRFPVAVQDIYYYDVYEIVNAIWEYIANVLL